jgi:acylglycerol lipase
VPEAAAAHREGRFEGAGGVEIWWQAWPVDEPRATVVLAHGAAEHSGRYTHVAKALNERGYSLWALDHRGHGHSEGRRALIDRLDNAIADLRTFIGQAREELGRRPFLLGHSMGGLLSTAFAIRHQEEIEGLVLSGPVAALEAASPVTLAVSFILTRVAPTVGVFGVDASEVSRDPEVVRAYEEDPLVFHGKLPVRTIAELAREVDGFPDRASSISLPILIMHGTADRIALPAGSELLHERVSSRDNTLRMLDGLYHEILNEPEQDQVIAEIADWLDAHASSA